MLNQVRHLRYFLTCMLIVLIAGCGGTARFKQTSTQAGYDKKLNALNVVIETNHLKKALAQLGNRSKAVDINEIVIATRNALTENFQNRSVTIVVTAIDSEIDKTALAKAVNINRAIPVLYIRADSFTTSTMTQYGQTSYLGWQGQLTWKLSLYDLSMPPPVDSTQGRAAWTADTEKMNYGPNFCADDKYLVCSRRFATSIVDQMKLDGLIR